MKYLILFLTIFIFSPNLSAQAYLYHPIDSTAKWVLVKETINQTPPSFANASTQVLGQDTIINGLKYKMLQHTYAWSSGTGVINQGGQIGTTYQQASGPQTIVTVGAIREDSLKRVYFYSFGNLAYKLSPIYPNSYTFDSLFLVGQERLLFDFGLSIGDTIERSTEAFGLDTFTMEVVAIDSILLYDSTYRKRFILKGYYETAPMTWFSGDTLYQHWVEGMGCYRPQTAIYNQLALASEGLLGGYLYNDVASLAGGEIYNYLRCYHENSEQLFGNTTFCDTVPPSYLSIYPLNVSETTIKVYPNPFSDQTKVEVTGVKGAKLRIQIFNIAGVQVAEIVSKNTSEIYIQRKRLEHGIYFYRLWADDQSIIGTGKLFID